MHDPFCLLYFNFQRYKKPHVHTHTDVQPGDHYSRPLTPQVFESSKEPEMTVLLRSQLSHFKDLDVLTTNLWERSDTNTTFSLFSQNRKVHLNPSFSIVFSDVSERKRLLHKVHNTMTCSYFIYDIIIWSRSRATAADLWGIWRKNVAQYHVKDTKLNICDIYSTHCIS